MDANSNDRETQTLADVNTLTSNTCTQHTTFQVRHCTMLIERKRLNTIFSQWSSRFFVIQPQSTHTQTFHRTGGFSSALSLSQAQCRNHARHVFRKQKRPFRDGLGAKNNLHQMISNVTVKGVDQEWMVSSICHAAQTDESSLATIQTAQRI